MTGDQNQKRRGPEKRLRIGVFPYVVAVLALTTIVLCIVDTRPGVVLRRAAQKTLDALDMPQITALYQSWQSGSVTARGNGETISFQARLPAQALLKREGKGAFSLWLENDSVIVTAPEKFSDAHAVARTLAARAFNAADVADSAEEQDRIRLFLAWSDPALALDQTKTALAAALTAADAEASLTNGTFLSQEGEEVSCRAVQYTLDSKQACAFLQTFFDQASGEELGAVYCAFYALQKKTVSEEAYQTFLDAISPTGKVPTFLCDAMRDPGAAVTVTHCLYRGKLCETQIRVSSPALTVTSTVRFGVGGKAGEESRADLKLEKEGSEILTLSVSHRVAEDTKKAYLTEASFSMTDQTGLFAESEAPLAGKIRFSYGREKKDLGLRFILGGSETYFRALMTKEPSGGAVAFTLNAWEENRKNTLLHAWDIEISQNAGNIPAAPEAASSPLPDASAEETS